MGMLSMGMLSMGDVVHGGCCPGGCCPGVGDVVHGGMLSWGMLSMGGFYPEDLVRGMLSGGMLSIWRKLSMRGCYSRVLVLVWEDILRGYLAILPSKEACYQPILQHGCNKVTNCEHEKDLKVVVDGELKFEHHINRVVKKANSTMGMIRRNFEFLERNMFNEQVIHGDGKNALEYVATVWNLQLKKQITLIGTASI